MGKKQEIKSLVADAKKDKRAKKSSIKKHEKEIAKLQNAFKVKERNMQNAHDEELAEMKMKEKTTKKKHKKEIAKLKRKIKDIKYDGKTRYDSLAYIACIACIALTFVCFYLLFLCGQGTKQKKSVYDVPF